MSKDGKIGHKGGYTTDKRKRWDSIAREIGKINGSFVKVGHWNGTDKESGTSLAAIALYNEKGVTWEAAGITPPEGAGQWFIPPRPAMAQSFDNNVDKYHKRIAKGQQLIYEGKHTTKGVLTELGIEARSDYMERIVSLKKPANADATIEAKGSSNPLVDDGDMHRGVLFEVVQR
jgi:hypothetical protein